MWKMGPKAKPAKDGEAPPSRKMNGWIPPAPGQQREREPGRGSSVGAGEHDEGAATGPRSEGKQMGEGGTVPGSALEGDEPPIPATPLSGGRYAKQ